MKKDMKEVCGEELICKPDNQGPTKTIAGSCSTTWPIKLTRAGKKRRGPRSEQDEPSSAKM